MSSIFYIRKRDVLHLIGKTKISIYLGLQSTSPNRTLAYYPIAPQTSKSLKTFFQSGKAFFNQVLFSANSRQILSLTY